MANNVVDWQIINQRNEDMFVADLEAAGVIRTGHFILRSFAHADKFVDIKGLYPHTRIAKKIARALAVRIQRELGDEKLVQIRGVVAPAMGGVILAHDTADWIGLLSQEFDREVLALFAEKEPIPSEERTEGGPKERFYFGRGYDEYIDGGIFVVVEDVMTSGGSVFDLIQLVERHGGTVLLVCCIWNRGKVGPDAIGGKSVVSLINRELATNERSTCEKEGPCSRGEEIDVKHGRGKEYVDEFGQPKAIAN